MNDVCCKLQLGNEKYKIPVDRAMHDSSSSGRSIAAVCCSLLSRRNRVCHCTRNSIVEKKSGCRTRQTTISVAVLLPRRHVNACVHVWRTGWWRWSATVPFYGFLAFRRCVVRQKRACRDRKKHVWYIPVSFVVP